MNKSDIADLFFGLFTFILAILILLGGAGVVAFVWKLNWC